ncbi:hypothetical protein PanWU01x14_278840 [Parasponia andersonii]|uniref:Uncharacterized protein n=1 Tax=Parasponia andersonii TaxID=3476 RepID=A0A2P5B249_PARAD|nr:hypothetical protein PanWU01x14_278840 [Parasponia andersonii]
MAEIGPHDQDEEKTKDTEKLYEMRGQHFQIERRQARRVLKVEVTEHGQAYDDYEFPLYRPSH